MIQATGVSGIEFTPHDLMYSHQHASVLAASTIYLLVIFYSSSSWTYCALLDCTVPRLTHLLPSLLALLIAAS